VHDYPPRPTGWATAAVRTLPASLPEGAQRRQGVGMARSIDAEITVEVALPSPPRGMPEVRGLKHRRRPPVHVIGIDELSRRKGQVYLTVVYDLERRVLLWVGDDRTEEAVKPFFTKEMGRRCHTLPVVCMDMWAAHPNW
jgi:hypothetical protein